MASSTSATAEYLRSLPPLLSLASSSTESQGNENHKSSKSGDDNDVIVIVHGSSSVGKTYSVMGIDADIGIWRRFVDDVFRIIDLYKHRHHHTHTHDINSGNGTTTTSNDGNEAIFARETIAMSNSDRPLLPSFHASFESWEVFDEKVRSLLDPLPLSTSSSLSNANSVSIEADGLVKELKGLRSIVNAFDIHRMQANGRHSRDNSHVIHQLHIECDGLINKMAHFIELSNTNVSINVGANNIPHINIVNGPSIATSPPTSATMTASKGPSALLRVLEALNGRSQQTSATSTAVTSIVDSKKSPPVSTSSLSLSSLYNESRLTQLLSGSFNKRERTIISMALISHSPLEFKV
jgi:hypothetical protein